MVEFAGFAEVYIVCLACLTVLALPSDFRADLHNLIILIRVLVETEEP